VSRAPPLILSTPRTSQFPSAFRLFCICGSARARTSRFCFLYLFSSYTTSVVVVFHFLDSANILMPFERGLPAPSASTDTLSTSAQALCVLRYSSVTSFIAFFSPSSLRSVRRSTSTLPLDSHRRHPENGTDCRGGSFYETATT
jgi:hypothetical protein